MWTGDQKTSEAALELVGVEGVGAGYEGVAAHITQTTLHCYFFQYVTFNH